MKNNNSNNNNKIIKVHKICKKAVKWKTKVSNIDKKIKQMKIQCQIAMMEILDKLFYFTILLFVIYFILYYVPLYKN